MGIEFVSIDDIIFALLDLKEFKNFKLERVNSYISIGEYELRFVQILGSEKIIVNFKIKKNAKEDIDIKWDEEFSFDYVLNEIKTFCEMKEYKIVDVDDYVNGDYRVYLKKEKEEKDFYLTIDAVIEFEKVKDYKNEN